MNANVQQRRLVLRAQSGDRDAFDVLLRDIAPPLLRYVARVTGDAAMADDVVQDTLITIVRKIAWLDDPALFRPWAYRIASREAFRALKKQRRYVEHTHETAVDEITADPWQRERLLASLEKLSPASRAVITLHYLEEMPLSEVAAVLDLPAGTVKSRLAYGLAQLRKEHPA
ncbi:MAG TPA: RNA polymerase sigma factor [Thermoanaerobaculia bacterium]|jgi:RNA polymerase sigma-70 factor (ECF subfamily)|nr:RNA polymerase sigma factor [Thermoanaerobaculia bacterium]